MDLGIVVGTVVDFLKLLIPLTLISCILAFAGARVREHLAEKFSLSWAKSCVVLNFVALFVVFLFAYVFFMYIGAIQTPAHDADLDYTLVDSILFVGIAGVRIFIVSLILSVFLLFFELVASFFIPAPKQIRVRGKTVTQSRLLAQVLGIGVACAIFLILVLFVFDWLPLGVFVYVFYGGIQAVPLFA